MWIWRDPERWVDSDMQRNAYLREAAVFLILAAIITLVAIGVGVAIS